MELFIFRTVVEVVAGRGPAGSRSYGRTATPIHHHFEQMPVDKRTLLTGRCRLAFEECEFEPEGSSDSLKDRCWLTLSRDAEAALPSLLGIEPNEFEWVGWFEATFYGTLSERGGRHGHFSMYERGAVMDEVISAQLVEPRPPTTEVSREGIVERVRRLRGVSD